MTPYVLTVDMSGLPQAWVEVEEAITYHAKNMVAWSLGNSLATFHGGWDHEGNRSEIETKSIIAIKGSNHGSKLIGQQPGLTNHLLFNRDRFVCAYCGEHYLPKNLSRDHIIPVSRGGKNNWTNVVTACRHCNTKKSNKTPEEAHMVLLYIPYTPNRYEHFILKNRRILADQMDYLMAGVPQSSRLYS